MYIFVVIYICLTKTRQQSQNSGRITIIICTIKLLFALTRLMINSIISCLAYIFDSQENINISLIYIVLERLKFSAETER